MSETSRTAAALAGPTAPKPRKEHCSHQRKTQVATQERLQQPRKTSGRTATGHGRLRFFPPPHAAHPSMSSRVHLTHSPLLQVPSGPRPRASPPSEPWLQYFKRDITEQPRNAPIESYSFRRHHVQRWLVLRPKRPSALSLRPPAQTCWQKRLRSSPNFIRNQEPLQPILKHVPHVYLQSCDLPQTDQTLVVYKAKRSAFFLWNASLFTLRWLSRRSMRAPCFHPT